GAERGQPVDRFDRIEGRADLEPERVAASISHGPQSEREPVVRRGGERIVHATSTAPCAHSRLGGSYARSMSAPGRHRARPSRHRVVGVVALMAVLVGGLLWARRDSTQSPGYGAATIARRLTQTASVPPDRQA